MACEECPVDEQRLWSVLLQHLALCAPESAGHPCAIQRLSVLPAPLPDVRHPLAATVAGLPAGVWVVSGPGPISLWARSPSQPTRGPPPHVIVKLGN